MSSVKIKDLPLKSFESITGEEILPTGGTGNFGIKTGVLLGGISELVNSTIQNILKYMNPVNFFYQTQTLDINNDNNLQSLKLLSVTNQKIFPNNATDLDRTIDYKIHLNPPQNGSYKIRLILNGAKSLTLCDSNGNPLTDINYVDSNNSKLASSANLRFDIDYLVSANGTIGTVLIGSSQNEIDLTNSPYISYDVASGV